MRTIISLLILALAINNILRGQDLLESPQHADQDYLFQLTNAQAQHLYETDEVLAFDYQLLQTLVDSVPFNTGLDKQYPAGHYLKVRLERDEVQSELISFQYFQAHLLENHRDFCLQLVDTAGLIMENAKVKINKRRIRFDEATQSYRIPKANRQGRLTIEYSGVVYFYEVTRRFNRSVLNRMGGNYVRYGTVKYVWRPIKFVFALPVEGVVSLIRGRATPRVYRTGRFFTRMYEKVACIFDDLYCNNHQGMDQYSGYLVTNKPIYRPGDTLRWKAFLVKTQNGKALEKPLDIFLWEKRPIKAKSLKHLPSSPGSYHGYFVLADSLNLQLDRRLSLQVAHKNDVLVRTSVRYEDYELKKNEFSVKPNQTALYHQDTLQLLIKATDDNELPLADARIELLATINDFRGYTADAVFIPDTLFYLEKTLSAAPTDTIYLPTDTFPEANFSYQIVANLRTTDNELRTRDLQLNYWDQQEKMHYRLIRDSILFEWKTNNQTTDQTFLLRIEDPFGLVLSEKMVTLPYQMPIETYAASYSFFKEGKHSSQISLSPEDAGLELLTARIGNQIKVQAINPHQLPFNYFFYELNREKAHGFTQILDTSWIVKPAKNAYLSVQYLWNGRMISQDYQIPIKKSGLQITTNLPATVNPGESKAIEIQVQDSNGKPVSNVDLTAFSFTRKFENYIVPTLPDLAKPPKQRKIYNEFTKNEKDPQIQNEELNYTFWNPLANLAANAYYNFRFPQDSVYTYSYPTEDSTTQFAPFFGGEPIHIIEVDQKPVYFSWTNHEQPYAFPITTGYHNLRLRLSDRMVEIDRLYFPKGQKTIIGLGETMGETKVHFEQRAKDSLSQKEQARYQPYLMLYQPLNTRMPYYLAQKDQILSLQTESPYQQSWHYVHKAPRLAGPVFKQKTRFESLEDFQLEFQYESGYLYEFKNQLLKMKSMDNQDFFPEALPSTPVTNLKSEALSLSKLNKRLDDYKAYQLRTVSIHGYPKYTRKGNGTLIVKIKPQCQKQQSVSSRMLIPLAQSDEFQVLPGGENEIYDLEPGWHRLYLFYQNQTYALLDSLFINGNGKNYYLKDCPEILPPDSFSIKHLEEVAKDVFSNQLERKTLRNIQQNNESTFTFSSAGEQIQGYIYDENGEPLIGASVLIKGTTRGTVSGIDGFFTLQKYSPSEELIVSYVGYEFKTFTILEDNSLMVEMNSTSQLFDELVVTGLGVQREKQQLGYSINVVANDLPQSLQGRIAGVEVAETQTLTLRGATSLTRDAPSLIVIDGVVFTGDLSDLSEDQIQEIKVLKGAEATAIYGSRAAAGVLLISTKDGQYQPKVLGEKADLDDYLEEQRPEASLRTHFKDDAFWQPTLRTDAAGKARFTATFPDDITNWRVFVLAMNERKQSQRYETSVKAYKALLAQLSVPRFLVAGDTSLVIGKTLNYSQDTLQVKNEFLLSETLQSTQERSLVNALIDTLQIVTPDLDTLAATYLVQRKDGYLDGEKRQIPIVKKGLTSPKGNFLKIKSDTTIYLTDFQPGTPILMRVDAGWQNALQNSIDYLKNYRYECNEQMASKLIAFLIDRQLKIATSLLTEDDREIKRLVKSLAKNQNTDGGWGWWNQSSTIVWISNHVRESLDMAKAAGFTPDQALKERTKSDINVFDLEVDTIPAYYLSYLENWYLAGEKLDYQRYLENIRNTNKLTFQEQLKWWRLNQRLGLEIDLSDLAKYRQKDAFGNTFFAEKQTKSYRWLPNQGTLQNTIDVIELLQQDNSHRDWIESNIDYLLRQQFYWNTYDRARFLKLVGSIIVANTNAVGPPQVRINGIDAKDYPFQKGLNLGDTLRIEKHGPIPVYLSLTQDHYEADPAPKTDLFSITTVFKDGVTNLTAGNPTELEIQLVAHQEMEYVWLKVPIPAACSYNSKPEPPYFADHVEYYKDHAIYYFNRLAIGQYTLHLPLQPRYAGNYQLNPAEAALMYFPVLSGNNVGKRVVVD